MYGQRDVQSRPQKLYCVKLSFHSHTVGLYSVVAVTIYYSDVTSDNVVSKDVVRNVVRKEN